MKTTECPRCKDLAAVVDLLGGGFDTASAGDEMEEAEI